MRIRMSLLGLASMLVVAGIAQAQPGTVIVEGRGGGMIPVGSFRHLQHDGGAYSIAAGYEFTDFLDMFLEFTHSFNDNNNFVFHGPGIRFVSNEVNQTFVVGVGPRINFMPSDSLVRPYGLFQVGWYHFAQFNSIKLNNRTILDDNDPDAVGIQAGLGIEGTIFQLYQRRGDRLPLLEVTLGAQGSYHQAFFPNRDDRQFVTAMGSVGVRF